MLGHGIVYGYGVRVDGHHPIPERYRELVVLVYPAKIGHGHHGVGERVSAPQQKHRQHAQRWCDTGPSHLCTGAQSHLYGVIVDDIKQPTPVDKQSQHRPPDGSAGDQVPLLVTRFVVVIGRRTVLDEIAEGHSQVHGLYGELIALGASETPVSQEILRGHLGEILESQTRRFRHVSQFLLVPCHWSVVKVQHQTIQTIVHSRHGKGTIKNNTQRYCKSRSGQSLYLRLLVVISDNNMALYFTANR
ncbi:hypothetical protein [Cyprinid herpesvirus 2]|nr:hypothetical protein [Cyprinid herpesvirus 2]